MMTNSPVEFTDAARADAHPSALWTLERARAVGLRVEEMIDELAKASDAQGRLTRLYLTPAHHAASELVVEWMERAGLAVRIDSAATVRGFLPCGVVGRQSARRLLVGSHIDTVVDGGRFDGALGIVTAIAAVEQLRDRGITLPFCLEILAFGDEEGVRFPRTMLSSSVVAGNVDLAALDSRDAEGISVRDALAAFGCDPSRIALDAYTPDQVIGYLEVHIEQGPVLDRADESLAVVSAIASQGRYRLRLAGEAGHAGTVPMDSRRDALAAAAEFITASEHMARRYAAQSLVATVGAIQVHPGAPNVIAGAAELSLDVRSADDSTRYQAVEEIRCIAHEIGSRRQVAVELDTVHEKSAAVTSVQLNRVIGRAIRGLTGSEPRVMLSGAGHDGHAMAHVTDIGMIFVRCAGGVSHNPAESVSLQDMGAATEALTRTIIALAAELRAE